MSDLSQTTKAMILARLDTSSSVTSLVPSNRLFPMRVESMPEYPFVRYGAPIVNQYEDNCGRGTDEQIILHAFSKEEDLCHKIAAAISAVLDRCEDFYICDWVSTQFREDDDSADVWHAMIEFRVVNKP